VVYGCAQWLDRKDRVEFYGGWKKDLLFVVLFFSRFDELLLLSPAEGSNTLLSMD